MVDERDFGSRSVDLATRPSDGKSGHVDKWLEGIAPQPFQPCNEGEMLNLSPLGGKIKMGSDRNGAKLRVCNI